ncbi:MAG: hypothetical protein HY304_04980 [candidate division Zixibacteria bacterium]|nr:hypothetical protein [candidate division Zixibacteria bacterium]
MIKRMAISAMLLALPLMMIAPSYAGDTKAANSVAVCGCGKVFTPDGKTEYVTANGKSYACCSHACHEMGAKDPVGAAKMSEAALAKLTGKANVDLAVANVVAVTEKGTKAVCGCGKEFTIDPTTSFLQVDGESYACCSKDCHEMALKDPKAAAKSAKEHMLARK